MMTCMTTLWHALRAGAAALLLAAAPAAAQAPMGLGTMAPGTVSHATGMAIAGVLSERDGPEMRVLPNAGEAVLMDLLALGDLDFAIANALEAFTAMEAAPDAGVQVAAVLYPLHVGLFVRADSDLHNVADLAGKRVTAGFAASPAIARLLDAVLAGGGLSTDDVVSVRVGDLVTGADRFVDGRADAFFFALGAAKLMEVNSGIPLRLLALPSEPSTQERIQAVAPVAYVATLPPRPNLVGVGAPTPTLSFDNLLVTREGVPDAAVTAVLEVLRTGRDDLIARFPAFAGLDPATLTRPESGMPYHTAAQTAAP